MNPKYLQTLEYPKILERLASHTAFSAGRELALTLRPSSDIEEIRKRQQETTEAHHLLDVRPDVGIGGARDVRPLVQEADISRTLGPTEFLEIRNTLLSARALRLVLVRLKDEFPLLADTAMGLQECPALTAEIRRCINDKAEVSDAASPELARIRREQISARQQLLARLNRIVTSKKNAPFLQEPIVTERSGRYVIPIKVECKGRIPGIVHDQSSSGATLFIEPLATVELNNRWRQLQLDEEREIERILRQLTALVEEHGPVIRGTVEALAQLDLAFAKGNYSYAIKGIEPLLTEIENGETTVRTEHNPAANPLKLIQARHPLLPAETVVPIDVRLGGNFTTLVITGPNTGGKTVALKTVGLLSLMAQAGLHIPAGESSRTPVFSSIYADIGDEQSIEQSLSTFSSHMTTIIEILDQADEQSLVLLDELGAGTDPAEGSALARALIATLLRRHIMAIGTTHYSELKVYAHSTRGVENASVEFDVETLSPTYVLTIGLPGRSNAFAIASRLGLSQAIIDDAQQWVSPEDMEADQLLGDIKAAREATRAASAAAQAAQREVERQERELAERLGGIEETRREILNEAREEARRELDAVGKELRRLKATLTRRAITHKWLEEAAERIEEIEKEVPPLAPAPPPMAPITGELHVGDAVWIGTLDRMGEVAEVLNGEAEVHVGGYRLHSPLSALELRHRAPPKLESPRVGVPQHASPGMELHLRGLRVEEAAPILDKYMDDAYLAGLPYVRIVHGKGTGRLRQAVREQLAEHPLVSSCRAGERHEGGEGVTIATLTEGPGGLAGA
ncbi:MAG: endonuclease MutS2 [Chloroflexota bacterium]